MSRRSAFWLAAAVGLGAVLAYLLAARRRATPAGVPAPAPATTSWAPDPGPVSLAQPVPLQDAPAPDVAPTPAGEGEQPLPTWVRAAIVIGALVAFFAVSLIATRNV